MKIENFDTGLKGQEDVENIIITPEENYKNKQKRNYKFFFHHIISFSFGINSDQIFSSS